MMETLWVITFLSQSPGVIKAPRNKTVSARTCEESNGALLFRSGDNLSIKTIIARGQWLAVEHFQNKQANE